MISGDEGKPCCVKRNSGVCREVVPCMDTDYGQASAIRIYDWRSRERGNGTKTEWYKTHAIVQVIAGRSVGDLVRSSAHV